MDDEHAKFKAFQSEWEAESAYLLAPDEAKVAHLRVFKDKGGLVRIDLQIGDDSRKTGEPAEHIQIVVGQSQLMRRLVEPQDVPPLTE